MKKSVNLDLISILPEADKSKLFVGLVSGDTPMCQQRRDFMYDHFLKLFPDYNFNYTFSMENPWNCKYNSNPIDPQYDSRARYDRHSDIASKRISAAYYIYKNFPEYKWIWLTNDNVAIDVDLLKQFIVNLTEKYDPETEIVIRGSCVGNNPIFLQGGSGYILSRFATGLILERAHDWLKKYTKNRPEDISFNQLLHSLGTSPSKCSTNGMIGHELKLNGELGTRRLKSCESIKNFGRECFVDPQPIDNVFAIHHNSLQTAYDFLEQFKKNRGKNIKWYNEIFNVKLCISDEKKKRN